MKIYSNGEAMWVNFDENEDIWHSWHKGSHYANVWYKDKEIDCYSFGWYRDRASMVDFTCALQTYLEDA